MNLQERIQELGYHTYEAGDSFFKVLKVYLHGDYKTTFHRMSRNSDWKNKNGKPVNINNVKDELK